MKLKWSKINKLLIKLLSKKNIIFIILLVYFCISHSIVALILLFLTGYKAKFNIGGFFKADNK